MTDEWQLRKEHSDQPVTPESQWPGGQVEIARGLAPARPSLSLGTVTAAPGCRTHKPREGLPVFKSRSSHVRVTHSHANAWIPATTGRAAFPQSAGFTRQVQF